MRKRAAQMMSASRVAGWTAWFTLWGALGGALGLLVWRVVGNQIPAGLLIAATVIGAPLPTIVMRRLDIGQNRLALAAWLGTVLGLVVGVLAPILAMADEIVAFVAAINAGLHGLVLALDARYGHRRFLGILLAFCGGIFGFTLFCAPVGIALDGALPDFWFGLVLLLAGGTGASIGAKLATMISNRLILATLRNYLIGHELHTGGCFKNRNFLVENEVHILPVAEDFAKAMVAGDIERAYALTTGELQARMTIEDFVQTFLKESPPETFVCQTSLMAEESVWAALEYEHRGLPSDIAPESFRQWVIITFNRDPEGRRKKECWGCWAMAASEAGQDRLGYFEMHNADWAVQRQAPIPLLVKRIRRRRHGSTAAEGPEHAGFVE